MHTNTLIDPGTRIDRACADTDPEVFFPETARGIPAAQAICARCPIRDACLAFGKATKQWGVWGGQELERGKPVARNPVGRPRKHQPAALAA
jgi:hypothetical protein